MIIVIFQVSFVASLEAPHSYEVEVTAGGRNISGSPGFVQVLAHVTQPNDWQIASQDILNGTLTGETEQT